MDDDEQKLIDEAAALGIDLSGVKASWAIGVGYNPNEYFYNTIMRKACEGIVTADDFWDFVGCTNWLIIDREDIPERHAVVFDRGSYVCEFTVRRVFPDKNKVEIRVDFGATNTDVLMHFDADELAIRMEDA